MSDDIAEFVSFWIPVTSTRGRRLISAMRAKVRADQRVNPGKLLQDSIDDITTEVIDSLVLGTEDDPVLRVLISP